MFCPYCGKPIGDGTKFCAFCGKEQIAPNNAPKKGISTHGLDILSGMAACVYWCFLIIGETLVPELLVGNIHFKGFTIDYLLIGFSLMALILSALLIYQKGKDGYIKTNYFELSSNVGLHGGCLATIIMIFWFFSAVLSVWNEGKSGVIVGLIPIAIVIILTVIIVLRFIHINDYTNRKMAVISLCVAIISGAVSFLLMELMMVICPIAPIQIIAFFIFPILFLLKSKKKIKMNYNIKL